MTESSSVDAVVPDTKDWTWVLREPCPECGYDARTVGRGDLGPTIRSNAAVFADVLGRPCAESRPDPAVWSPLEYACHVRDVHRIFDRRLASMLVEDLPRFANWDQDETAIEERYAAQDRATVAGELTEAAAAVAATYDSLGATTRTSGPAAACAATAASSRWTASAATTCTTSSTTPGTSAGPDRGIGRPQSVRLTTPACVICFNTS